MKASELKARHDRYRQIKIGVIGRKSGRSISVPVWFAFEGDKPYLLLTSARLPSGNASYACSLS